MANIASVTSRRIGLSFLDFKMREELSWVVESKFDVTRVHLESRVIVTE